MSKIYFVMPAYNEAENIEETVKQWYPVVEKLSLEEANSAKFCYYARTYREVSVA